MAKSKKQPKHKDADIKEKVINILDIPKEIVLNVPKITVVSNSVLIENYKGVVEYDQDRIRVNSGLGLIKIEGQKLEIKGISSEDLIVQGNIERIEFLK